MTAVLEFLSFVKALEFKHPAVHMNITKTIDLGYLAWIRSSPAGELICMGRGKTAEEACRIALDNRVTAHRGVGS